MSDYILEMNHITKAFSGVKALDDVILKGDYFGTAICNRNVEYHKAFPRYYSE